MTKNDLTVQILREIRDEIRSTNQRLDQTNQRLDQTNQRLDQTNQRLDQTNQRLDQTRQDFTRALTESEVRTATAITQLAGAIQGVRDLLSDRLDLRDRVERCELEIERLKQRPQA